MSEYPKVITADGGVKVTVYSTHDEQWWAGAKARRERDEKRTAASFSTFVGAKAE